jgi:type II secretory pathway component PulM
VAILVVLISVALLAAVVLVIAAPLRSPRESIDAHDAELQELEARREAKYREIRDAELDFRTGKLSREDHAAIDAALRSEALDILNRLEGRGGDVSAAEDTSPDEPTPRGA